MKNVLGLFVGGIFALSLSLAHAAKNQPGGPQQPRPPILCPCVHETCVVEVCGSAPEGEEPPLCVTCTCDENPCDGPLV